MRRVKTAVHDLLPREREKADRVTQQNGRTPCRGSRVKFPPFEQRADDRLAKHDQTDRGRKDDKKDAPERKRKRFPGGFFLAPGDLLAHHGKKRRPHRKREDPKRELHQTVPIPEA